MPKRVGFRKIKKIQMTGTSAIPKHNQGQFRNITTPATPSNRAHANRWRCFRNPKKNHTKKEEEEKDTKFAWKFLASKPHQFTYLPPPSSLICNLSPSLSLQEASDFDSIRLSRCLFESRSVARVLEADHGSVEEALCSLICWLLFESRIYS